MNQKIKIAYNLEQDNMKWFDLARLEISIYLGTEKVYLAKDLGRRKCVWCRCRLIWNSPAIAICRVVVGREPGGATSVPQHHTWTWARTGTRELKYWIGRLDRNK